jgi:hypothetical protein
MPALHDEVAFEYRTGAGAGAGVPLLFRTQWPSFLVFFGASFRLKTALVKLFVYFKTVRQARELQNEKRVHCPVMLKRFADYRIQTPEPRSYIHALTVVHLQLLLTPKTRRLLPSNTNAANVPLFEGFTTTRGGTSQGGVVRSALSSTFPGTRLDLCTL